MPFVLAKAVIDAQIARITAAIDAARAERSGLATRRAELQDTINALQAELDDLQAAKVALA